MKKEWFLVAASILLTIIIALAAIRWFAPQLLGLPVDLQMVRVSKKVPPFYDGVFRQEDFAGKEYIIRDPYIIRAKPFLPRSADGMGPNDILGFRNKNVPNVADIITIGDSQTYGNNVFLEQNWPSRMLENLQYNSVVLYNMSVGGWGAAEYFEIFNKALYLQPRVVVVAFYTGNDPLDTFIKVYSDERWKSLRFNPKLKASDAPTIQKARVWKVEFNSGKVTVFTPNYRHLSNKRDNPVVLAGYEIMGEIAKKIGEIAEASGVKLVFTIIPTKELVFKKKIDKENIELRSDYTALVEDEEINLMTLAETLRGIQGAVYVDLLEPLQQAVITTQNLYPQNHDGHPQIEGYRLIGKTLSKEVLKLLPGKISGGIIIKIKEDKYWPFLVRDEHLYEFVSPEILAANGWFMGNMTEVPMRDIRNMPFGGMIGTVDPSRFGPQAFER